jgi:site-specific recombinase XerD
MSSFDSMNFGIDLVRWDARIDDGSSIVRDIPPLCLLKMATVEFGEAYLFTGREGPLKKRMVQQLFAGYAEKVGIEGRSVHALRHSIAVHLLEAGRGIEYVADRLGHKNIQNTRIYAQITHPLRAQVFQELEQHPKIVRIS